MLQARHQPSTSVFRHPKASTAILLPSDRVEPLRSCFRMDGKPKDLVRCHERGELCSQNPRHSNNFVCRRSPSRLREPAPSIHGQRDYCEDPLRFRHLQIADQGSMGTVAASARPPRQHYLFEMASRQCVIARASLPEFTSSRQTFAVDSSKQKAPRLLRFTSSLHRTSGQCDIRNSADNVSLAQPVRRPRALSSTALTTDTSGSSGFGSVLEVPQQATRESGGFWESWEQQDIIALKELKAATKGMEQNVDQLQGRRIRLFQDNTVVVSCLRKFSS